MSAAWQTGSSRQWRTIRAAVLNRDGYRCQICGAPLHPRCTPRGCDRCAHVDHRVPRSHGGPDHPANLRAACQACNLSRGSQGGTRTPARTSRRW